MKSDLNIPDYLAAEFSLFLENMQSLDDPENPDLLKNYLKVLFTQLKKSSDIFNGLVDQLAMAITTQIRIDEKKMALLDLSQEPQWSDIRACVGVHPDARTILTELMEHSEDELKAAVLLIYFYNNYDATPLPAYEEESDTSDDDDNHFNSDDY